MTPAQQDWYPDPTTPGRLVRVGEHGGVHSWQRDRGSRIWHPGFITAFALATPIIGLVVLVSLLVAPMAALALVPAAAIFALLLWWVDRPLRLSMRSKLIAGLWGAAVSTTFSMFTGTGVAVFAGMSAAAVVGAPLFEETTKLAGVAAGLWVGHVRNAYTGVVYACWSACGFAFVEDVLYLASADAEGMLGTVFVVRVLGTPFAHVMFTLPAAVALAEAWQRRNSAKHWWGAGLGVCVAIGLHATWNGGLIVLDELDASVGVVVVYMSMWFALFVAFSVTVIWYRRRARRCAPNWVRAGGARCGLGVVACDTVAVPGKWWKSSPYRKELMALRCELAGVGIDGDGDHDSHLRCRLLIAQLVAAGVLPGGAGTLPGWYVTQGTWRWWTGNRWW